MGKSDKDKTMKQKQTETKSGKQKEYDYKVVSYLYEGTVEQLRSEYEKFLNDYCQGGYRLHSIIKDTYFVFEKEV